MDITTAKIVILSITLLTITALWFKISGIVIVPAIISLMIVGTQTNLVLSRDDPKGFGFNRVSPIDIAVTVFTHLVNVIMLSIFPTL